LPRQRESQVGDEADPGLAMVEPQTLKRYVHELATGQAHSLGPA
jgi:hypothetical protein